MTTVDPLGNEPENMFTEQLDLQSNNREQIYILDHAPFFGNLTLRVKGSSSDLVLGDDYNLVYRVEELKGAVDNDVYNGIEFLKDLNGTVTITGQMLDRSFKKPLTDLATEMLRYLNEPIKTKFENVEERPSLYPAKPTYRPWYNIGNKEYVASATDDLAEAVKGAGNGMSLVIQTLKERTVQLRQAMIAINMPGHISAKNPHNVEVDQLNAHPVGLAAADTILGYGYEVLDLIRRIRSPWLYPVTVQDLNGFYFEPIDSDTVVQKPSNGKLNWVSNTLPVGALLPETIDKYIPWYGAFDVDGLFQFADGKAELLSEDGLSSLSLNNGTLSLKTNGVVVIRAGYLKDQNKFLEISTGKNTLRFESSGYMLDDNKITLNGIPFVTTDNVFDFNPEAGDSSNETIELEYIDNILVGHGRGTPNSPFTVKFEPPLASETVPGAIQTTTDVESELSYHVISAQDVPPSTSLLIPSTWTVNGNRLDRDFNLDKESISLGSVDNVPDKLKPLSDKQKEIIDNLSDVGHRHDTSDLTILLANMGSEGKSLIVESAEEFVELSRLIEELPEVDEDDEDDGDHVPETDYSNRLFGTSHDFFEALRQRYYNTVPESTDVFDIRNIELSATSGAKFSVSGGILTALPGYKYMVPNRTTGGVENGQINNGIIVGEIKGGLSLQTVSTEQWVSSACTIDKNFPVCKVYSTNSDGVTIQPVLSTPHDRVGTKERFVTEDTLMVIDCITNTIGDLYVDGVSYPLSVGVTNTISVELAKGEHVVTFNLDGGDSNTRLCYKATYLDLDNKTGVLFSTNEDTLFGGMSHTAEFDGRFYLYCNALNGNVFATIGSFDNAAVSTQFIYIGHVDVENGVVQGGPELTYKGVIEFGSFVELEDHKIDPAAHNLSNIKVDGLEEVEPFGIMSSDGVRRSYGTLAWSNSAQVSSFMARDTAIVVDMTSSSTAQLFLALSTNTKSPAQFKSYRNAAVPQTRAVYEGCFQYYGDDTDKLVAGLMFIKGTDTDKEMLYLGLDVEQQHRSKITVSLSSEGFTENVSLVDVTTINCQVLNNRSFIMPSNGYVVEGSYGKLNPVGQVTYRYIPSSNSMTVMYVPPSKVYPDGTVLATVKTFQFFDDVSEFFGSDYVGIYMKLEDTASDASYTSNKRGRFSIAASPFPIPVELGDYRLFIDYDELFKTYLAADTVSEFSFRDNGIKYDTFRASPYHVNEAFPGQTGYFGETELGTVTSTCELSFPVCMLPDRVVESVGSLRYPLALSFKDYKFDNTYYSNIVGWYPIWTIGSGLLGTSLGNNGPRTTLFRLRLGDFCDDKGYDRSKVQFSSLIIGNTGISYRVNSRDSNWDWVDCPGVADYSDGFVKPQDIVLEMISQNNTELDFGVVIIVSGDGNYELKGDELRNYIDGVMVVPEAKGVLYYTPWHITQKTWDWYCAVGKNKLN